MNNQKPGSAIIIAIIALAIGLGAGYWYGGKTGFQKGRAAAEADVQKVQAEATKQATEAAAKAANPFQVENPLEKVESNPFEKVKKALNPFE